MYQDIKKVHTAHELEEFKKRVEDLYGKIPSSVNQLFERRKIDLFVNSNGVYSLEEKNTGIVLTMDENWTNHCNGVKLFETMNRINRRIELQLVNKKIEIRIKNSKNTYEYLMKIIQELECNQEIYESR